MRIGVLRERAEGEDRVSIIPETIKRLSRTGAEFVVERDAGVKATYPDGEYEKVGAEVADSAFGADLLVKIDVPTADEIGRIRPGTALLSLLYPLTNTGLVRMLRDLAIDAIAVDMIPRTTPAQSMDVLSSQSNLAGYKGVVLAAAHLPRFFPMMMTAAGTIRPAKVLVLGAGVAGLQAIATAKRLGASVEAFDVRKAAKEQVESLGARFVMVDEKEDAEGEGGYAKEAGGEYRRRQAELIHQHTARSDVVVTTALIPGKRSPTLLTEAMVRDMPKGSVIVDIAAPMGGNCELTQPGRTVVKHDVTIIGHSNLPSTMPHHASQLYSRNMEKLLGHLLEGGSLKWDMADGITAACAIVRDGKVVHPRVRERMG